LESKEILRGLINKFDNAEVIRFFRSKNDRLSFPHESLYYEDKNFSDGKKLAEGKLPDGSFLVCSFSIQKDLTERSGKKAQYELARKILKSTQSDAGIFIFYDPSGNFRFSLVYTNYLGRHRDWSSFKRFTYFVSREFTNKTFLQQVGEGDFSTLEKIKEAFSVEPVTDLFYDEFFVEFQKIVDEVKAVNKIGDDEKVRDFVLLFTIRTIFIGFIQKKGWLGNDEKFLENFLEEYRTISGKDEFYRHWLRSLFFESLNSPPGRKITYTALSEKFQTILQMAPYLNGGLFIEKPGYDNQGWVIPDQVIYDFFEFLFSHSFTIDENSVHDTDLEVNPEFLGIIFERLVNKEGGAVYTQRTEVDLMCRLSLLKYLQKNLATKVSISDLYELLFREISEEQKSGNLSEREIKEILLLLEDVAICDPAVGSGAFLVGMLQVIDGIISDLQQRLNLENGNAFERKKLVIGRSLYGVEVKEWAVWICQLRLWLTLFVDAPDELKFSPVPILPSLEFKVYQGDSLVQRIGSNLFPVRGHIRICESVKHRIANLKKLKIDYYENRTKLKSEIVRQEEIKIYKEILDAEIENKRQGLWQLKSDQEPIDYLFDEHKPVGDKSDLKKDKIEFLEREIQELEEEKDLLSKEKPLIWGIEFADVFAEKGGFDIVIGNPPYVRQEVIADPSGKIKDKREYKKFLEEMVRMDFPKDFSKSSRIDARSDLYTYFYIRGLHLLNPKGIHTFICSNSWLDVGYGAWLQKFLLTRCRIEFIIDNLAKRSFKSADVNTIISIIHAPETKVDQKHLVKFIAFKKPFEEVIFTENLLDIENADKVCVNDIFRVYPISIEKLLEAGWEYLETDVIPRDKAAKQSQSVVAVIPAKAGTQSLLKDKFLTGKYIGNKWGGKYLRAPEIFFKILEKGKDKLVRLWDIAGIEGYIHGFNVGDKFHKANFIESMEDAEIIKLDINAPGVKKYGVKKQGNSRKLADLLFPRMIGDRFLTLINYGEVYGQKFYKIILKPGLKKYKESLGLFLNSSFQFLQNEVTMLSPWGLGALSVNSKDVKIQMVLYDISCDKDLRVTTRPIKSIFEELGFQKCTQRDCNHSEHPYEYVKPEDVSFDRIMPDRRELDKIVFEALGLTEEEQLEVYRAVLELVKNRLLKARSR